MHAITAFIAERTPGQGWSEQGYLKVVGIGLGIAVIVVAFRNIFGKK